MATIPKTFQKIMVKKLTTDFSEATEIVTVPMLKPSASEVLIKNKYLGINASDINASSGKYFVDKGPPFDIGFEAIGEVVAVGENVKDVKPGDAVAVLGMGCFAEYICIPHQQVCNLPSTNPDFMSLIVSGRTAAIGLDKQGSIQKNEVVLVTAAAGGTGQLAVQYAKDAGCHVIGTCSSDDKVQVLKKLGCDRPVNYKKENLDEVLKKEYPKGVDVVWETIGGDMFKTCLNNLAIKGRLVVVGYITHYQEGYKPIDLGGLPQELLMKSASVSGFLLLHYASHMPEYHKKLMQMYNSEKLKVVSDLGKGTQDGLFKGLESVARAVAHLHSGNSTGKVIVEMS